MFKNQIVLVLTPQVSDTFRYIPLCQLNISFIVLETQLVFLTCNVIFFKAHLST